MDACYMEDRNILCPFSHQSFPLVNFLPIPLHPFELHDFYIWNRGIWDREYELAE